MRELIIKQVVMGFLVVTFCLCAFLLTLTYAIEHTGKARCGDAATKESPLP